MSTCSPTRLLTPAGGYSLWAASYDDEANPMLSLEQRILAPLLPPMAGLDVVDIGCGTGRWLEVLKGTGARSLLGVDLSPEMLSHARTKLGDSARFVCADYTNAPIAIGSADVVFCNFVLSYIDNPGQFLKFVSKILRPGGLLFLSDVHPGTSAVLNWRRGVRVQNGFHEIRTHQRAISDVTALCRKARLKVDRRLEPKFGDEERSIFEQNGKQEYFDQISEHPAIYLLQLSAPVRPRRSLVRETKPQTVSRLRAGRFALGSTVSFSGEMRISGPRVEAFCSGPTGDSSSFSTKDGVDMQGYLALPGLINAHDHLEFALFPRLGKGGYQNFLEWAEDIHHSHSAEIARHRQVPKEVRLWWGGIRNLLCGVTTVCHHNPYDPDVFNENFIVRVLRDFGWAHSLALEPGAALKKKTTPKGQPFFLHLAEGIDESSAQEIFNLRRAGALDAETVVVHGIGMGEKGSALLRSVGAGLIWCPSSNLFLFGQTTSAEEIQRFPNAALGSDSPLTAQGDLLDEVSCAYHTLNARATDLYHYITRQAATLLRLRNAEGSFRVGGVADLVAVRDTGQTPAETLVSLSYRDVELVLIGGRIQLASTEVKRQLPASLCEGLQPLSIDGTVRWIRAPLDWLFTETTAHLGEEIYLGGKQVRLGN
jgi:cytosine/adenosine deaminase-related metal-dependent hydrolase/SAM-dependent methyltransferase